MSPNQTLISIVVPTYNREETVEDTIESILAQNYKNFEIVVVDDGSTDDTTGVVNSFSDPRIKCIQLEENQGVSKARNVGIEKSDGEYILFVDSDDKLMPEAISKMVGVLQLQSDNCAGVVTSYVKKRNETVVDRRRVQSGPIHHKDLTKKNVAGGTSCTLFKRDCLKEVGGFDTDLPKSVDLDLFLRILNEGYYLYGIDEFLLEYRIGDDQITRSAKKVIEGSNGILKKHGEDLSKEFLAKIYSDIAVSNIRLQNEGLAEKQVDKCFQYSSTNDMDEYLYVRFGKTYCEVGRPRTGARYFLQSIHANPKNKKLYVYLISSFLGSRVWESLRIIKRTIRDTTARIRQC